jgi:hypothetical protein
LLIGVAAVTFFTVLIPPILLVQSGEQHDRPLHPVPIGRFETVTGAAPD